MRRRNGKKFREMIVVLSVVFLYKIFKGGCNYI